MWCQKVPGSSRHSLVYRLQESINQYMPPPHITVADMFSGLAAQYIWGAF